MANNNERPFLFQNLPRAEALKELASFCPSGANKDTITAVEAYNMLLETASTLMHHLNAGLSGHGLTQARFRTLFVTYRTGRDNGVSPCELAKIMRVERATITSLVDGLERDGLAIRKPDPEDRRSIKIHLTPRGREVTLALAPKRMKHMMKIISVLSTDECKTLMSILDKLEKSIASQEGTTL